MLAVSFSEKKSQNLQNDAQHMQEVYDSLNKQNALLSHLRYLILPYLLVVSHLLSTHDLSK